MKTAKDAIVWKDDSTFTENGWSWNGYLITSQQVVRNISDPRYVYKLGESYHGADTLDEAKADCVEHYKQRDGGVV